ncbi:tRNA 2-thiouridine(34) synthase MnmA [uncultured Fluviicola sp.]|uniref:tRNA 2-thiouridine(34) synthase MnmA n=1 Tax=uncultured Fluviicola sp. TaxID=463303 RepID=UPI0025CBEBA4|nr:tRNA 2-thiouridine(34) synthase MnmA [uncultured Fluviicola sp.]
MKRVVVGLSGGVDSSVTAHLLQQEGYEVIGLFMRNWHDETVTLSNDCPWIDDSNDALLVAEHLGIPFQVLDLSKEYKERIVDYMFAEYEAGRTPNPDVLCNREIKFDVFLKAAMELGADYVATGHYCRKTTTEDGIHHLLAGLDPNKDQSYFLCQLSQEQLSKALFPIGNLQKSEVRAIAKEIGLVTAEKKDSQGLCFVGKISLPEFLQQKLQVKHGKIIEINELENQFTEYSNIPVNLEHVVELSKEFIYSPTMGLEVEKHIGAHYYTIGQRKGLHIGGRPNPSFVIGIDTETNTVYSGQKDDHPGLNKWALKIETKEMHWINPNFAMNIGDAKEFDIRIRYRQALQKGILTRLEDGYYILFDKKQRGIAPGQFAALYLQEELIGSGIISH